VSRATIITVNYCYGTYLKLDGGYWVALREIGYKSCLVLLAYYVFDRIVPSLLSHHSMLINANWCTSMCSKYPRYRLFLL
jgi:hypothetical protein